MSVFRFIGIFLSPLVCFQFAIAAPLNINFSSHYVQFYKPLKTSHDLAKAASSFKHSNRNVAHFIKRIHSAPAQALPKLTLRGGRLYFKEGKNNFELIALGGSKFSLDGQRIDLNDDLSTTFAQSLPAKNWWLSEAHAVPPLVVGIIILLTALTGAGVCINSSISEHFGTKEIAAKWLRADEFNRYLRKIKQSLKPLCPGAAWADAPSTFDYALFFENYCGKIKSQMISSGETTIPEFDADVAGQFYGAADEADQAIIQEVTKDPAFMNSCMNSKSVTPRADGAPASERVQ